MTEMSSTLTYQEAAVLSQFSLSADGIQVAELGFDMLKSLSPSRRAQYVPSATSLRISLSTVRSATAVFSQAFSASSSFDHLA